MSTLTILLQNIAQTDSAQKVAQKAAQINYIEVFFTGGLVSWVIVYLSLFSLIVSIDRLWVILRLGKGNPEDLFIRTKQILIDRGLHAAKEVLSKNKSSYSTILREGLDLTERIVEHKFLEKRIDEVAQNEIAKMERSMGYISLVAGTAPMLGFLGTVMGMIKAFAQLANQEASSATVLAEGIYQAMGTTFGGLLCGIVSYVSYSYLTTKIYKISSNMDKLIHDFVVLMQSKS